MTKYSSMSVSIASPDDSSSGATGFANRRWVRLEQIKPKEINKGINVETLYRMWSAAATGSSAQMLNHLGCPVEIRGDQVHIFLGFYAWPSSPDLEYELSSSIGNIVRRSRVYENRRFPLFVNNVSAIELPYYMISASAFWKTPKFRRDGEQLFNVTTTLHDTWLEFSEEVFGVVEVSGIVYGESAAVEIILDKSIEQITTPIAAATSWYDAPDNTRIYTPAPTETNQSVKISNVQCTVTATWLDEYGNTESDSISLESPQCVVDLLSLCPDMFQQILRICTKSYILYVHYNACTGEITDIIPDNPTSYCSQEVVTGPGSNLITGPFPSGWLR